MTGNGDIRPHKEKTVPQVMKKRHRQTRGVLFFRNIPGTVKAMHKATCYRRGDDMTKVQVALMKLYIDRPDLVERYLPQKEET